MAKQNNKTYYNPFVTTGGTYENPRLGITDYGAFNKGFKQGLQPGMDFMKEQEEEEKVDKEKRKLDASLIKDIELVGGEYFDTGVWNPNVDIKNSTKNTLVGFRDELLNKNTTEERKKEIRSSYQNLVTANASLAHILDVDSDSELYSKNASNLNELFVDQGTTLDDFRQAYNDGKAIPTVQNGVGGYLVNGKFIDFENKINVNTVNEKMNLRSDNKVNEAATSFAGQPPFKTAPTSTAAFTSLNNDGSKEYNTKVTTILNEYGDSASVSAEQAANQWAVNNQSMLPGIVQDMRSAKFLTKDERTMLNTIEPRHNRFNADAVQSEAKELFESANREGRSITMEEATDQIMQQHKDFKDSLAQRYLKNEFLKKTAGFKVNPDTGIAELYDPRKDTSQGLATGSGSGSGSDSSNLNSLDYHVASLQNVFGTIPKSDNTKPLNIFDRVGGVIDTAGNISPKNAVSFVNQYAKSKNLGRAVTAENLEDIIREKLYPNNEDVFDQDSEEYEEVQNEVKKVLGTPAHFYYFKDGKFKPATQFGSPGKSLEGVPNINPTDFTKIMKEYRNTLEATQLKQFESAAKQMGINIYGVENENPTEPIIF